MDAQDYLDWSRMAGLYLRNISHVDRYRTYQPLLSPAGLTTVIVGEFLESTDSVVDFTTWRTHSVYERGDEQKERITRTAEALEAIGAARASVAVQAAQSSSPFDKIAEMMSDDKLKNVGDFRQLMQGMKGIDLLNHMRESVARNMPELADQVGIKRQAQPPAAVSPGHESREQIEHLLEKFVAAHQSDLNRDLNRHGDPRLDPGYTREDRLREIDLMRKRLYASEAQQDAVVKLQELTAQIRKLTGKPADAIKTVQSKLEKLRLKFRALYKEHRATVTDELIPELAAALKSAEAFMTSLPELFASQPLGDAKTTARLESFGEYETKQSRGTIEIQWDNPRGLECDWAGLELRGCYPKSSPQALERLLDALDLLRARWQQRLVDWQDQLITTFRDVYWVQMSWEADEYDVDDEGDATVESILSHVDSGQIVLEIDPEEDSIRATTFFHVEWDEEHGFEIHWEADVEGSDDSSDVPSAARAIGLQDSGPPLVSADVIRFESMFHLELPERYRQFLLAANGGRPQRHAFTASAQGQKFPANVVQFFSLTNTSTETHPAGSLQAAIQHARDNNWPATLLPIAAVRNADPMLMPEQVANYLLIVLSGANAGRILLANPDTMTDVFPRLTADVADRMAAAMMEQLADSAPTAGRSLAEFLGKLKAPESDGAPVWLKAIRENDIAAFQRWIQSGGKCDERFQERGFPIPLQVIDYLTCHASAELLEAAAELRFFKPGKLRDSWSQFGQRDVRRFQVLMQVLPVDMWRYVLSSHQVWDHPDLWEQLATAGVNFNDPVDDEGQTPIHLAVQFGKTAAVKWLLQHGADPHKFDKYQRNAFTWTDRGPGYDCLANLEGKENAAPPRTPQLDVPSFDQLDQAAKQLPNGTSLVIIVQIKSPPVTEAEKRWSTECHYRLTFDIQRQQVTFNSMTSPRQDYLYAEDWPSILFVPVLQWPQLTPLWETLEVQEFDWNRALKKRNYQPTPRPDLRDAASEALHQSLNSEEAAARMIRLRK